MKVKNCSFEKLFLVGKDTHSNYISNKMYLEQNVFVVFPYGAIESKGSVFFKSK